MSKSLIVQNITIKNTGLPATKQHSKVSVVAAVLVTVNSTTHTQPTGKTPALTTHRMELASTLVNNNVEK
jgi:hypothetical protein